MNAPATPANPNEGKERIAKYLARLGVASRRGVEALIAKGGVQVNGKTLETAAFLVDGTEKIIVNGQSIGEKEKTRLFLFHKPGDLVTSHQDEKGRETVFDYLKTTYPDLPRVISVGRLDLTTEGLLLLTNNGELSRYMELPATAWIRTYRVRVFGTWTPSKSAHLAKGIRVEGVHYGPIKVELDTESGDNRWLTVSLQEGKNREIRKVMDAVEMKVNRLIRTSYGPFQLSTLPRGKLVEVPQKQLKQSVPQDILDQ